MSRFSLFSLDWYIFTMYNFRWPTGRWNYIRKATHLKQQAISQYTFQTRYNWISQYSIPLKPGTVKHRYTSQTMYSYLSVYLSNQVQLNHFPCLGRLVDACLLTSILWSITTLNSESKSGYWPQQCWKLFSCLHRPRRRWRLGMSSQSWMSPRTSRTGSSLLSRSLRWVSTNFGCNWLWKLKWLVAG